MTGAQNQLHLFHGPTNELDRSDKNFKLIDWKKNIKWKLMKKRLVEKP